MPTAPKSMPTDGGIKPFRGSPEAPPREVALIARRLRLGRQAAIKVDSYVRQRTVRSRSTQDNRYRTLEAAMSVLTRTPDSPVLPEQTRQVDADPARETGKHALPPHDRQGLHALARAVRGIGWLLGFVILVVGTVMAARAGAQVALLLRVIVAAAIVASTSAAAWLISRYADRKAA